MAEWVEKASVELLGSRTHEGVWGYRKDLGPCAEATALACLGLLGCERWANHDSLALAVDRGAEWLTTLQNAAGSLAVSPRLSEPGWATPHAMLLWKALGLYADRRGKAARWLLHFERNRPRRDPTLRIVVDHDPDLVGWQWTQGTDSWLEPTAMAVIALAAEGLGAHPRVEEGSRLILDRSLPHGGWNYGNRRVFGRELRPHPGPTGLALVALASRRHEIRPRSVGLAIGYLIRTLPEVRAPVSLGWGVLGLRAWDAAPAESNQWLVRSHAAYSGRNDAACGLGLLLLAAAEPGPELVGARAM